MSGGGSTLARLPIPIDFIQANMLTPSAGWTGTAGSGFATTPTDPARTTAKPACRMLTVPHQYFTDRLLVGVAAAANNNGSLANLGLTKVRFHYEGATYDVLKPTWQTVTDANGTKRRYLGWWAWLKHDGRSGAADLYAEAFPADATMQNRVMGPYPFYPSATLHDYDLTVAPSLSEVAGSRYQTVGGALNYLRTQSAQNPRITIAEAGDYEISTFTQATTYRTAKGWCTIRATAAVTIKKASFEWSNSTLATNYGGLKFTGANITFDMVNVGSITLVSTPAHDHWFDGVTFTQSAGRSTLWAKGIRPLGNVVNSNPYFTECTFEYLNDAVKGAQLARGCTMTSCYNDSLTSAVCCVGNVGTDYDATFFNGEIPAFTVQYSGSGTGTLSLSGSNDASSRTFTARVAGASVGTFAVQNSSAAYTAGTNYDVADVVAWLNGLSGWSATVLDDTRRATACTLSGSKGAFTNADCKTAPLTVITRFDLHADWYQQLAGNTENVICTDNLFWGALGGQLIFLTGGAGLRDFVFINNALHCAAGYAPRSQIEGVNSHLVIAHCTVANQALQLSYGAAYAPDSYCLIANSVFLNMGTTGTVSANVPVAKDNHLFAAYSSIWPFATGTTTGGDDASLFADAGAGDFTPAGELLTNAKAPIVKRDRGAALRGVTAAVGAVA